MDIGCRQNQRQQFGKCRRADTFPVTTVRGGAHSSQVNNNDIAGRNDNDELWRIVVDTPRPARLRRRDAISLDAGIATRRGGRDRMAEQPDHNGDC